MLRKFPFLLREHGGLIHPRRLSQRVRWNIFAEPGPFPVDLRHEKGRSGPSAQRSGPRAGAGAGASPRITASRRCYRESERNRPGGTRPGDGASPRPAAVRHLPAVHSSKFTVSYDHGLYVLRKNHLLPRRMLIKAAHGNCRWGITAFLLLASRCSRCLCETTSDEFAEQCFKDGKKSITEVTCTRHKVSPCQADLHSVRPRAPWPPPLGPNN